MFSVTSCYDKLKPAYSVRIRNDKFALDHGEIRSIMTMQYINDSTLDTPQPLIKTLFYCIGCK